MTDHVSNSNDVSLLIAKSLIDLQRRDLKSRNIRFALVALFVVAMIAFYFLAAYSVVNPLDNISAKDGYVALVRVDGPIVPSSVASAERVTAALTAAFKDKDAKGLILSINSPGGSPVQSSTIVDTIKRLRSERPDFRVIAVGEDLLTSGAYMVSLGASEIYINRSTVAGSIGVVSEGFGFTDLISRYGVERRIFTAGEMKRQLDPFLPPQTRDVKKLQTILAGVHKHFIDMVMESRKDKLKGGNELFTGDVWLGEEAVAIGIVDGIASAGEIATREFGVRQFKNFSASGSILDRLGRSFGSAVQSMIYGHSAPVSAIW